MWRLALIPNKGSREQMSKGDGQEEDPGFTHLG